MERTCSMKLILALVCVVAIIALRIKASEISACCEPDPALSAEAIKRFPANKWIEITAKPVIPEKWKDGRYVYINTYSSLVYCGSIGAAMTMDGYTYTPVGKSCPNNYSDSVYT